MNTPQKIGCVAAVLLLWTALASALIVSDVPWSNEAWSAIPALNLAEHGYMGTTVLASQGTWLRGLDAHTYWIMPAHPLVQAIWYEIVGFSLFRQRSLSVIFGLLALGSWFVIVRRLSGSYAAALLALLMVGFERNFLNAAASGRMDMMAAGLGACGLAIFFELRASAPRRAIWLSHTFAAAAIFTHPCGILFAAALLIAMFFTGFVRIANLSMIALPYLLFAAAWGFYIARAPQDFRSQFLGNVSGFAGEYLGRERFSGIRAPWKAVWIELRLRYLQPFGLIGPRSIAGALNSIWLMVAIVASAFALFNRRLRSESAVPILASCAAVVFLIMTFFEGMKFQHYLVYSLPFLGSLAAVGIAGFVRTPPTVALAAIAVAAAIVPQAGGVLLHYHRNPLRSEFIPVAAWLEMNIQPGDHVIAPAELGYALRFTAGLSDDVRLGYYTGERPRFIVTSDWYRAWIANSAVRDPAVHHFIETTLDAYSRVFSRGDYTVYEKRPH